MDTDLVIPGEYPGLVFDGTVTEASDYAQDRESLGDMYRALNASFTPPPAINPWAQESVTAPTYAIKQYGSDGSIGHLAPPPGQVSWAEWGGGGQRAVYDVRDFGAIGDGTTDDTDAINAAAAAAGDQTISPFGGIVYLPTGRYLISSVIRLYSSTTLRGNGCQSSVVMANTNINGPAKPGGITGWYTDTTMIANYNYDGSDADGPDTLANDIYIADIGLYGNGQNNFPPAGSPSGTTVHGGLITLNKVANQGVYRCTIQSSSNHGIDIQGYGSKPWLSSQYGNFHVVDCTIDLLSDVAVPAKYNSGFPIRGVGINNGFISGNVIGYGNLQTGIFPNGQHTNDAMDFPGCTGVVVTGNQMTNCVDGIGTNAAGSLTITGNVIQQNYGFGIASFAPTAGSNDGSNALVISRNVIDSSLRAGIKVEPYNPEDTDTLANVVVSDNTIQSGGTEWAIDLNVRGIICHNNSIDLLGQPNAGAIHVADSYIKVYANVVYNGDPATSIGVEVDNPGPTSGETLVGIHIARNNLVEVFAPITYAGLPLVDLEDSTIRKNLSLPGATPLGMISAPLLVSGSPVKNQGPFDCRVAITGGSKFVVKLGGYESSVEQVAPSKDAMYFVPVGMNIEVDVQTGGTAPTWEWFAS